MTPEREGKLQAFPATQWSLVERARQSDTHGRHEALSHLLQRYSPALRSHLLFEKRLSTDRAEDVLQGFIADKIIENNLLEHAIQGKGKFRSFLLATLNNYFISRHRAETAAKRTPEGGLANLDGTIEQVDGGRDPAEQFNIAWARELVAEALRRMETECTQSQRADHWTIFHARILRPCFEGQPPVEYEQLVLQLGLEAPVHACRLLATAKRMFARHLHAVAAEYAGPQSNADAEIKDLREALSICGAQSAGSLRNYL